MQLQYLDFEFSDEENGRGSFDAMASVFPDRVPAVLAEMTAVLHWAINAFGPCGQAEEEGEWAYDVQGLIEPGTPLNVMVDERSGDVSLAPISGSKRATFTLTLTGTRTFCEALRRRFEIGGWQP